jgi:hypothetical protein
MADAVAEITGKFSKKLVDKLRANDDFNMELARKALPFEVLTDGHLLRVGTARTNSRKITIPTDRISSGRIYSGDSHTTYIETDDRKLRIRYEGQPVPLEQGDQFLAFIPAFTYTPVRTGLAIAALKVMRAESGGGLLTEKALTKMLDEEEVKWNGGLDHSLERFRSDHAEFSVVGAWERRPLSSEETAYGLAKIRMGDPTPHLRGEKRTYPLVVSGPNHNESHPFYQHLDLLKERYGKK